MGRTLKRVPLDFAWPQGKVWGGYLNPFWAQRAKCPDCDGTGLAPEAKRMREEWYGDAPFDPVAYGAAPLTVDHSAIVAFATRQCKRTPEYYGSGPAAVAREARRLFELYRDKWSKNLIQADVDALVAAGRLMDFTHVPRTPEQEAIVEAKIAAGGNSWLPEPNGYTPTADEVNAWAMSGSIGHDSINQWVCVEARCKREGFAYTCARCGGDGDMWPSPEVKKLHDEWKEVEPPEGPGFQLWETTSEGSPSSPVFATLEALCDWCAVNATTFGSFKASASDWRSMLDAGFVSHRKGHMVFL